MSAHVCACHMSSGSRARVLRRERAVTLPLMSRCIAEIERLMHSGSSPLAATGLPRATADDSFNCFQSFRLVSAQWRRVPVFVCARLCVCVQMQPLSVDAVHMWCVFDECVCQF